MFYTVVHIHKTTYTISHCEYPELVEGDAAISIIKIASLREIRLPYARNDFLN
jgi:hypothetical protein